MNKKGKPLPDVGDVICTHEINGRARRISRLVVECVSRRPYENRTGEQPRPHNTYCITARLLDSDAQYDPESAVINIDVVGECDDASDHLFIPRSEMSIVGAMKLKSPYTFTPVRRPRSEQAA